MKSRKVFGFVIKMPYIIILTCSFSMIIALMALPTTYAQETGLPSGECQSKIMFEENKLESSVDKVGAVYIAISSPEFQSIVSGHKYALALISTNDTWNSATCNDVRLAAVYVGFNLFDTASSNVKSIRVVEDANASHVTTINTMPTLICSIHCYPGKLTSAFNPELRSDGFLRGKTIPNSTMPLEFDLTNTGNYTLYNVTIIAFYSPMLSKLHSATGDFDLMSGEEKTTSGTINTPSKLLNVPLLLNWVVQANDKAGNIGTKDFEKVINLANMSSYERTADPQNVDPPLKQFRSGIGFNGILCNEGYTLIAKAVDGSPACVRHDTANILIERGWAKSM